ncbi:MAG: flagellar hook-length control protein FliK [Gammaproteobacteria bacterium]|nr:flagellar hook-length control protein FliK [Gammaproteobacteria bacterium]
MEIKNNPPTPAPHTATSQTATQQKATARSLQVGQTLKAVVIESLKNSVKLRIGNTLLQAPTAKQHQNGETLTLTVVRTGDKPLLRVAPPLLLTTQQSRSVQNAALKILLPKQAPLTPLLANLSAISQLKTQLTSPLTPEISNSVRKLIENITHIDKVGDPKALRQAILDSGILLEKKLANLQQAQTTTTPANRTSSTTSQAQAVSQDFKANLVQLLGLLRQAPASHQSPSSKIPLPLTTQDASIIPNTSSNTRQPHTTPNLSVKEQLLRLLNTPSNRISREESTRSTAPSRLAELTTSSSRIPVPFFRHLPLQPQKTQSPTLVLLQHRDQIIDELIRQSESSIARVQLSQLASMPQDSNTSQSWAFELPLRNGENIDVVQLRIEKEDTEEGEEQDSRWRITLTLDLPAIGTIYATITVQGEQTSTTLWADEESTVQLIDNNLQLLRDALDEHGVSSDEINCQHGSPPAPPRQQRHTLLVDTRV